MTQIDTSAEATRQVLSALREGPNLMFDADVADFIEALAAERDALQKKAKELDGKAYAQQARAINAEADRDRLAAERDDLRMCAEAEADAVNDMRAERDRLADALRAVDAAHAQAAAENARMRAALIRLRDCDWTIGRGDRMDPVRDIARAALTGGTDNG